VSVREQIDPILVDILVMFRSGVPSPNSGCLSERYQMADLMLLRSFSYALCCHPTANDGADSPGRPKTWLDLDLHNLPTQ
jgi:hypothetical protein